MLGTLLGIISALAAGTSAIGGAMNNQKYEREQLAYRTEEERKQKQIARANAIKAALKLKDNNPYIAGVAPTNTGAAGWNTLGQLAQAGLKYGGDIGDGIESGIRKPVGSGSDYSGLNSKNYRVDNKYRNY